MNEPILTDDGLRSLKCSRCGEKMTCGAKASACWCQNYPPLPAGTLDARADCMCASCLEKLHAQLAEHRPC